ncbi:MAG: hypothetical protein ACRENZ_04680, partial [Thermodesulfobacteriota bacterium]
KRYIISIRALMKKVVVFSSKVFVIIIITLLILEFGLWLFPSVIPPGILIHFNNGLRKKIARGRFPTFDDTVIFNRDDNGPELRLWKPFTKITARDIEVPGDFYIVKTDEIGFCNPSGFYSQASNIDVITIGDSFTWCNAVRSEDTWTKRLSDFSGLSTYNIGKGGMGLYEYLQILKGFGIQKSPRFVILNVYEGNDLRDDIRYQQSKYNSIELNSNSSYSSFLQGITELINSPLGRYSYSFNLFLAAIKNTIIYISSPTTGDMDFRYRLGFPGKSIPFNLENSDLDEVLHARLLLEKEIGFDVFTEALKIFVRLSKEHNFIPIVIYTPSAHTTYAAYVVFNDPTLADVMQLFSNSQREFFRMKGKELGYVFIDLTPSLQAAALSSNSQNLLYYRTNLHITKQAHEIIAKTLSESMQNLGLLEQDQSRRPD